MGAWLKFVEASVDPKTRNLYKVVETAFLPTCKRAGIPVHSCSKRDCKNLSNNRLRFFFTEYRRYRKMGGPDRTPGKPKSDAELKEFWFEKKYMYEGYQWRRRLTGHD